MSSSYYFNHLCGSTIISIWISEPEVCVQSLSDLWQPRSKRQPKNCVWSCPGSMLGKQTMEITPLSIIIMQDFYNKKETEFLGKLIRNKGWILSWVNNIDRIHLWHNNTFIVVQEHSVNFDLTIIFQRCVIYNIVFIFAWMWCFKMFAKIQFLIKCQYLLSL